MAAGQDAKGQTHVTAAGRKEVEEQRLLQAHASIEQDDEVSWGGEDREHGEGRLLTSLAKVWVEIRKPQTGDGSEQTKASALCLEAGLSLLAKPAVYVQPRR